MNIYVGNLDYNLTEEELQNLFEEYGAVSVVKIIKDRDTGRAKGFGFVEMDDESEGQTAIDELNGVEVRGRAMKVNKAKPPQKKNRF
jgi:RNA recognition motif-containing protein